ncbi:MAG: hypothetical protein H6818_02770 [Phycisphaerales bacterium]|nr:hypothetical protein [Phycisphaerales bacterium]MCB9863239.1 hypothetical protein [Phycisphaerales bacterium]
MSRLTIIALAGFALTGGTAASPSDLSPDPMIQAAVRNSAYVTLSPETGDDDSQDNAQNTSLRDRAVQAIKDHKFADAEKLIHEGRKTRSSRRKDQWKLIEARLELERENFARAGLLAMEVVILRERSEEHAAALYWAGRAYEELGRPNKAIQLYEECRSHKTAPDGLIKVVSRRIEQLREPKKS